MADWIDSAASGISDWWNRSFGSDSSSKIAGGGINDPNLGPTGWSSGGEAQWSPSGSGTDWSKVASAIEDLTKGEGDSKSGKATTVASSPNVSGSTASTAVGRPMTGTNLDTLVAKMQQQRQAYLDAAQAAKGSQGYGQPVKMTRTTGGLLGF